MGPDSTLSPIAKPSGREKDGVCAKNRSRATVGVAGHDADAEDAEDAEAAAGKAPASPTTRTGGEAAAGGAGAAGFGGAEAEADAEAAATFAQRFPEVEGSS
jgi:hypothetical protein